MISIDSGDNEDDGNVKDDGGDKNNTRMMKNNNRDDKLNLSANLQTRCLFNLIPNFRPEIPIKNIMEFEKIFQKESLPQLRSQNCWRLGGRRNVAKSYKTRPTSTQKQMPNDNHFVTSVYRCDACH